MVYDHVRWYCIISIFMYYSTYMVGYTSKYNFMVELKKRGITIYILWYLHKKKYIVLWYSWYMRSTLTMVLPCYFIHVLCHCNILGSAMKYYNRWSLLPWYISKYHSITMWYLHCTIVHYFFVAKNTLLI